MKADSCQLTYLVHSPISPAKHHLSVLGQSRRRVLILLGVMSLILLLSLTPAGAKDGDLDPNFNPGVGVNYVPTLWDQKYYNDASGKSIVGGSFTQVGGVANRAVARLLADGSPDPSFTSPVTTAWVNNCWLLNPGDPNSKILIAGPFEVPSPAGTYYGLARLNANGTVDTSFARTFAGPCPGMSGFGVQSSGKIIVAGYALAVNGDPGNTYYLLRLNADGTVDDTFPKRSAPGGYVRSVQAYPATDPLFPNQVRLLGCFPRFSDPMHLDYMVLLNENGGTVLGSLGDEVVNGPILQLWIQGDNKMVIVGDFNRVYTTTMNGVARLLPLPTGGLDPDFNIGTGANAYVQRVVVDSGNKPVLAGYFTSFNGTPCGYLVRLNYNGSVDATFNTGGLGADDRIWTLFKRSDNTWIIEGAFQNFNGSPRQCIANLAVNGTLNSQYASFNLAHTGTTARVYTIEDSRQGLYIGGYFSGYGGKYHSRIARLNFDGTLDASFKTWMDGTVTSIRTKSDGKILVAGNFGLVYGYTPRTGLARFNPDGTVDRAFKPIVVKADGSMPDLAMANVLDNGQILIAGDFAQVADANRVMQPRSAFARLNADGSLDPTFNAQIDIPGGSNIRCVGGGEKNGKYDVGGYVYYNGAHCGFYTRLTSTGALDLTFGPTGGQTPAPHVNLFNGEVRCGYDTADGKLILGGDFTAIIDNSGSPPQVSRIARFTTNGLWDNTFLALPGANNPIYYMERQWPGNKILIGGTFTSYNGVARNYLARINQNGSADASFDPGAGPNGPIYAIQWNDYWKRARIGGAFTTYQGVSRVKIAQVLASNGSVSGAVSLLLLD